LRSNATNPSFFPFRPERLSVCAADNTDGPKFIYFSTKCHPPILKTKLLVSAALLLASLLSVQTKPVALSKAYVGKDNLVHLVDTNGKDVAIAKERDQVDVSQPKLADDKQTAGWLIHRDNCCTSYSIPTGLLIHRTGKKLTLDDGMMIYDWCFVEGSAKVAMSTGTVQGMETRHLLL
jgi:hypothetical protein